MNTQNLLFERSSEMPEGLYIELMNKLKIDFGDNEKKMTIITVSKGLPKYIQMSKQEMIQQIIKESVEWEDRQDILLHVTQKRLIMSDLKELCITRKLPTMKLNPKWVKQEELFNRHPEFREMLRDARRFPPMFTF
jgi:hypothetical protein